MEELRSIIAMGGGSPIDAAKAMWIKYEYPEITFEEMCEYGCRDMGESQQILSGSSLHHSLHCK